MPYVRPYIYTKQTSPIFDCVTPVSVSLATLARRIMHTEYVVQAQLVLGTPDRTC